MVIEFRWLETQERPPPRGAIPVGQIPQSSYMVLQYRSNALVSVDGITGEETRLVTDWKNVGVNTP